MNSIATEAQLINLFGMKQGQFAQIVKILVPDYSGYKKYLERKGLHVLRGVGNQFMCLETGEMFRPHSHTDVDYWVQLKSRLILEYEPIKDPKYSCFETEDRGYRFQSIIDDASGSRLEEFARRCEDFRKQQNVAYTDGRTHPGLRRKVNHAIH